VLIEIARIAIWNKNGVAMAVAIGAWGIDAAFLIVGKYLLTHPVDDLKPMLPWLGHSCSAGESQTSMISNAFLCSL
jgi:hypothetical protein